MCLEYDYYGTRRFLAQKKRRGGTWVRGYKLLQALDGQLRSPFFFYDQKDWKPGVHKSNSRRWRPPAQGTPQITRGIHVYLVRADVDSPVPKRLGVQDVCVPVRCCLNKLLGLDLDGKTAVFKEVHLSRSAYRKALKGQPKNEA